MKRLKILYLCHIYPDGPFGDSVRIRELISNLALDNEVTAIAPVLTNSNHNSLGVLHFKRLRKLKLGRFGQISDTMSSLFSLIRTHGTENYDLVFETFGGPFAVTCCIRRLLRAPIVIELHGLITEEERMYNMPRLYTDIIHPELVGRSLRLADGVVTVTPGIKGKISELYGVREDRIKIIPNGVNTTLFRPMDQSRVRRDLKLDEKGTYIGFVGNLVPWQGVEYLIKAAPAIIEGYEGEGKVMFLIVGDGISREKLQKMVRDVGLSSRFIFTGKVEYELVPKYINSFDLCVAPFEPSFFVDASPLKIFDYMACGKAILASNTKGVADLLMSSKAGVVVSHKNSDEFAGAIIELLRNNELRQSLGKNGLLEVKLNHDWKIRAGELAMFFEDLLESCS
jgi:glycosyltransferase involved in cell wall biosynthesis